MVPISESLERLARAADNLNQKTDDLNDVVGQVEDRLAEAGVGVTCWLETAWCLIDPSGRRNSSYKAWCLGYTKLDSKWQLAVKQVEVSEGFYQGDPNCPYTEFEDLDDPIPLPKAPRVVRVGAADHLEALIDALTQKVDGFVESIDKASQLVQS